eukprot:2555700-Amphidinium_carterae.1
MPTISSTGRPRPRVSGWTFTIPFKSDPRPWANCLLYILKGFKALFAKWRFGTLAAVCRDLVSAEGALQAGWKPEKLKFKDSGMRRQFLQRL